MGTTANVFWRNVGVGLLSWLVASIPLICVATAMRKDFIRRESWDEHAKRRQLTHWRRRNQCLWALSGLYNCGCILFLVTFLANVRAEDGRTWLESIIAVLVVIFIIQPFLLSLLCTFVTAVVVKLSPDLIAQVRHDFISD